MSLNKNIRVLVVGLGSIGQRHARLLGKRVNVELLLCDAIKAHGDQAQSVIERPVKMFTDYSAALREEPAVVVIGTPNHLHVPMSLAALRAGADVLVEKPIAETVLEANELIETACKVGRNLHVGYMLRFDSGLQKLKRMVDEGAIGTLCSGRAMIGTYVTLLNSRGNEKESSPYSLVFDYTHEIDFIRWFFGEPADVQAAGAWLTSFEKRPRPNVVQILLQMQSGALVQVHLDYIQFPQRRTFELSGDRGTLTYDFMTGEIRKFGFEREHRWESMDVPPISKRSDELFRAEHESVFETLLKGTPSRISGKDGLATLRVAEMAIAAARTATSRVKQGVIDSSVTATE